MRIATFALVGAAALGLAACDQKGLETGTPVAGGQSARAMLMNAAGVDVGRATATDVAGGLRFTVDAKALPRARTASTFTRPAAATRPTSRPPGATGTRRR